MIRVKSDGWAMFPGTQKYIDLDYFGVGGDVGYLEMAVVLM